MLWLLQSNDLSNPVHAVYVSWTALQVAAAIALALLLIKSNWRGRVGTGLWAVILPLGLLGWVKVVFFGIVDLGTWNSTAGIVAAGAVGVAMLGVVLLILSRWLWRRQREPQPARRIAADIAFWGALAGTLFALDFVEKRYQVPAFWIAIAVALPVIVAVIWWREGRSQGGSGKIPPRDDRAAIERPCRRRDP